MNGCSDPYAATDTVSPANTVEDITARYPPLDAYECTGTPMVDGRSCELGQVNNPTATIALVGDSHADHLLPPLLDIAEQEGWRILVRVKSSCSMFELPRDIGRADLQKKHDTCVALGNSAREELTDRDDIDLVLFSSNDRANRVDTDKVATDLETLVDAGVNVAIVSDMVGITEMKVPTCVERAIDRGVTSDPCAVARPTAPGPVTQAALATDVPILDLESQLCGDTKCHVVIGGTIVSYDRAHLAVAFARTLAPWLESEIAPLLQHR